MRTRATQSGIPRREKVVNPGSTAVCSDEVSTGECENKPGVVHYLTDDSDDRGWKVHRKARAHPFLVVYDLDSVAFDDEFLDYKPNCDRQVLERQRGTLK